ncbi:MAG: GNAT family N-acetyltransferase [Bradyrhizobium sp.]
MAKINIPDLPPDIRFAALPDSAEAFEFSFAVKKQALGPHIRARWPWDEEYQRQIHRLRLAEKLFFAIHRNDDAIGTLSWQAHPDHFRFGEFYLLARHQRGGLGTRILRHALALADAAGLPVRLEYLKWNPVGTLYLRHGFRSIGETGIHVLMERPPSIAPKIRTAVRSDAATIHFVRREAILAKSASHYDPVILYDWADAGDIGRLATRISDPDYCTLVAEAGGEIIGFAMASLSKGELLALYARPNRIGNIGRDLLAAIEQLVFQAMPLLVCEASLNAEGFYTANGFISEGQKDFISSSGLISRVVQMKKHRPNAGPNQNLK